jgi:protein TonB
MAIGAFDSTSQTRCSWLRIGGLSGTLFVHCLALALLAIPVAMPSLRPAPPELSIRWIEAPPEPVLLPIPDEPVPLPRTQVVPAPVAAPIQAAQVPVESAVAEPVSPVSLPSIASSIEPAMAVAESVSDTGLEYESIVRPKYPVAAMRRGEQGTVLVRVTVGRDGLPTQVDISRSSGSRDLDRAAREAVWRWRFRPVRINGVAVLASGIVPVAFELANR